jgi:soluble lytic murein transglycosylase-like protein
VGVLNSWGVNLLISGKSFINKAAASAMAALCLSLFAVPASAQIYSWRDGNGNLVLANTPKTAAGAGQIVPSYPAAPSHAVRTPGRLSTTASDRALMYDGLITEHAQANDVRPDLVRAVVQVESAFNPRARSPKGAQGLMQLMPATAQQFGVKNAYNPEENVRAGVAYLRQLLDRYRNDEELALAAYNAGPGAVDKYGQNVPPYAETKNYVAQINQITARPIAPRDNRIFKVTEVVDGRPVVRYTDKRPASGTYSVIGR